MQQLVSCSRYSRISLRPPRGKAVADPIHELEFYGDPDVSRLTAVGFRLRVSVEIHRWPPACPKLRVFSLLNMPMLLRLVEGRVDDWLWNFVAHNPKAFWMASSFSFTSG